MTFRIGYPKLGHLHLDGGLGEVDLSLVQNPSCHVTMTEFVALHGKDDLSLIIEDNAAIAGTTSQDAGFHGIVGYGVQGIDAPL